MRFAPLALVLMVAPADPAAAYDLDKMIADVAENSLALEAVRADIAAELARAGLAGVAYRPDLSFGITARRWQDSSLPMPKAEAQSRPGAQLTWRVFDWGATAARVKAESHTIRAAVERHRRKIVDMLGEAGHTYIAAWSAQAKIAAFSAAMKCADSAKDIYVERRKQQIATEAQMRSVASELGLVQNELMEARGELAKAVAQLKRWTANPAITTERIVIRTAIIGLTPPEAIIAEADIDRWRAEAEAARASRLPAVDAIGNWDHTAGDTYSDVMVGARVRVDLFDQSGAGERLRVALAEFMAAQTRLRAAEENTAVKLATQERVSISARQSLQSAEDTIELERLRLDDTRSAFASGRGDAMMIAQACRRLSLGTKQKIEAQARLASASLQVRIDVGDLP